MYYDDFRFHRGPSVDDDPTLTGPAGEPSASAQEGQASQTGDAPRMNLNGQSRKAERPGYDPYRQGGSYERAQRVRADGTPRKKAPSWGKRIASLALCGVLFGGVAGLTFHGTSSPMASMEPTDTR